MASRHDRIEIHTWDGVTVLDLGEMDIWDGADLSLLRDTLAELIDSNGHRSVGVNLEHVKYIPSGFFGMLSDWYDKGIAISLYRPQENVANMLWFRHFFHEGSSGCYQLLEEQSTAIAGQSEWDESFDWQEDEVSTASAQ